MNVEGGSFARCVRHPSQFITGFCSSCLVERLSNVDPIEKAPDPSSAPRSENEIVEISASSSVPDSHRNEGEVRVRRTLLFLFQLDDSNDARVDCESKASTSGRRDADGKNSSLCSSSLLSSAGFRWRFGGSSKSGRFADEHLERKRDLGHSCDWRACRETHESHDSGKGGWEKPRHSWDGSVMSKALACSFACLEEPQDGSSRIKGGMSEENAAADSDRCRGTDDIRKADEKPSSPHGSLGSFLRERHREHHEEFHRDMNAVDVGRKKSHRWSRVWDWSITSPFRDLSKKREHGLERSLSGTWQEVQRREVPGGTYTHGNGLQAPRANQCLSRNLNGGNGDIQIFRSDGQRKREYRFGRSRSVHYRSPGNMDNGLLRFYLTPMRTSRRTSSGRVRTSHFFPKGILGH